MQNPITLKITMEQAGMAEAAVLGTLYTVYGEDPQLWKQLKEPHQEVINHLQDLRLRLSGFLDPWDTDQTFLQITRIEAELLRLCFRVFSNGYPDASTQELQELFSGLKADDLNGKGLLQPFRQMDDRLGALIGKRNHK